MWGWVLASMFGAIFSGLILLASMNAPDSTVDHATSMANSMLTYSNAVVEYAKSNPAVTGTVADAALTFPGWYANPGWSNDISAGRLVTVFAPDINAMGIQSITYEIAAVSLGNYGAGYNNGGVFVSPFHGVNAAIVVPGVVPNSSPMFVTQLN